MKRETKEQCYRELYQAVRETYGADQVSYPEKRINYDFTVTISGLPVEFSLKAEDEMDLLLLQTTLYLNETDPESQYATATQIQTDYEVFVTPDQNRLLIKRMPVFSGVADAAAAEQVKDAAWSFFHIVEELAEEYDSTIQNSPETFSPNQPEPTTEHSSPFIPRKQEAPTGTESKTQPIVMQTSGAEADPFGQISKGKQPVPPAPYQNLQDAFAAQKKQLSLEAETLRQKAEQLSIRESVLQAKEQELIELGSPVIHRLSQELVETQQAFYQEMKASRKAVTEAWEAIHQKEAALTLEAQSLEIQKLTLEAMRRSAAEQVRTAERMQHWIFSQHKSQETDFHQQWENMEYDAAIPGCTVSQEEYDAAMQELFLLKREIAALRTTHSALSGKEGENLENSDAGTNSDHPLSGKA